MASVFYSNHIRMVNAPTRPLADRPAPRPPTENRRSAAADPKPKPSPPPPPHRVTSTLLQKDSRRSDLASRWPPSFTPTISECWTHQATPTYNYPGHRLRAARKTVERRQPQGYNGTMEWKQRITLEPGKCGGRPCIRGFRIRVKDVLELLAHGASWEEILEDYPDLEREDIQACLHFAAAREDHSILQVA